MKYKKLIGNIRNSIWEISVVSLLVLFLIFLGMRIIPSLIIIMPIPVVYILTIFFLILLLSFLLALCGIRVNIILGYSEKRAKERKLEWSEGLLYDSEIIPVNQYLIDFFRIPMGYPFHYGDKIKGIDDSNQFSPKELGGMDEFKVKEIAIGLPEGIDKNDEKLIIDNTRLDLAINPGFVIKSIELKDCRIFYGVKNPFIAGPNNRYVLDNPDWKSRNDEVIYHIKQGYSYWAMMWIHNRIKISTPIRFTVLLLGEYGRAS